MSNLGVLVKTNLINTLGINHLRNKNDKKGLKHLLAGGGVLFSIIMIGVLVTIYFSLMAKGLKAVGMLDLMMIIASVVCVVETFFTSVYKSQGILFGSRDLQQLMSLPISMSDILASKVIELLIINYLFSAVVIIPSSIIYFINDKGSIIIFIYSIIGLIFIPLLPIVIASIIGFLISFISSKVRNKNAILSIVTMIFLIFIVVASFKANEIIEFVLNRSGSIVQTVKTVCPVAFYFSDAVSNLSILSLIKLAVWSVLPFIIFIMAFSKSFKGITSRLGETYKRADYKMENIRTSSASKAILMKEIRRYISSPVYLTNTIVGVVLSLIAAIAAVVIGRDELILLIADGDRTQVLNMMKQLEGLIQFIPIGMIALTISLTCTTDVSISLEGKKLWIIKSLPIGLKDIAKGKILLNLIITIPVIIIDTILFSIAFKLSPILIFFTALVPILVTIYTSIAGFLINLYFPRFDWINETQVVKQSISSMLGLFNGIIVLVACTGISILIYKLFSIMNMYVYLSVIVCILVILILAVIIMLKRNGEKLYYKLG